MISARIPLVGPDEMSPGQRAVFDRIVGGRRGALVGPLRAALHNPELADRWQALGQVLRYDTCLPAALSELAILIVGRHWTSELEWTLHAAEARRNGIGEAKIENLRLGRVPAFTYPAEREVYEFTRELLTTGRVSDPVYADVLARWGVVGVVEQTALVGYYSMVAMTLNAHRIPLPPGIPPELDAEHDGLAPLPPAPPRKVMFYDPRTEPHGLAHNPWTALVMPRPIGWISTLSPEGIANLAPYSFYNAVCGEPPFVMFSSVGRKDRTLSTGPNRAAGPTALASAARSAAILSGSSRLAQ